MHTKEHPHVLDPRTQGHSPKPNEKKPAEPVKTEPAAAPATGKTKN